MEFKERNEYIEEQIRKRQQKGLGQVETQSSGMKFVPQDKGKAKLIKTQQKKGLDGNTANMWADASVKYDPTALSRSNAKPTAVPATKELANTPRVYGPVTTKDFFAAKGVILPDDFVKRAKKRTPLQAIGYGAESLVADIGGFVEGVGDYSGSAINSGIADLLKVGSNLTKFNGKSNAVSDALYSGGEFVQKAADNTLENSWSDKYKASIKERYNPNKAQEVTANITGSVATLLPTIGINAAVPGAGLATMGASVAGRNAAQAKKDGANATDALLYGTLSGATEVAIEKAFGGIPELGKGFVPNLVSKLKVNPQVKNVLEVLQDVAGEGAEEALSTAIEPLLKRTVYDKNADFATKEQLVESAVLGGISSLLLKGAFKTGDLLTRGKEKIEPTTRTDVQNTSGPVNDVVGSISNPSVRQEGEKINSPERNVLPEQVSNEAVKPQEVNKTAHISGAYAEEKQHYLQQVDDAMRGKLDKSNVIVVGSTPPILQKYGANDLKLTMNQSSIRKIAYPDGYMGGKHNLGFAAIEMLPEQLNDPVAILKSNTQDDSVIVLTEMLDAENRPVIVPLHLNKEGIIGVSNRVASMYGRERYEDFIKKQDEQGNLIYAKDKESLSALSRVGLQLPKMLATKDPLYTPSIRQEGEKINSYDGNISPEQVAPGAQRSPLLNDYRGQIANEVMKPLAVNKTAHTSATVEEFTGDGDRTAKSVKLQERAERKLTQQLGDVFGIDGRQQESYLPVVQELSKVVQRGDATQNDYDKLFNQYVKEGVVISEDFYNQYKDLKNELRTFPLAISETDTRGVADWADFRRRNFGVLNLKKDGVPVDVAYEGLSQRYPEMFGDDVTHPIDKLERMSEVAKSIIKTESTLEEYYGDDYDDFIADARRNFDDVVGNYAQNVQYIAQADTDAANAKALGGTAATPADTIPTTSTELRKLYDEKAKLQRVADRVTGNTVLTERDSKIVKSLLDGTMAIDDVEKIDGVNHEVIMERYNAQRAVREVNRPIAAYNKERKEMLLDDANDAIETSDKWKDKDGLGGGLRYSRETMERNFEDIIKDPEVAKQMNANYIKPVHDHEADATRYKNKIRDTVKELKLNEYESMYVQLKGEYDYHVASKSEKSRKQAEKLKTVIDALTKEYGDKIDVEKSTRAVDTFRQTYDRIYEEIANVMVLNGYAPPKYRKGYFPHFQDRKLDGKVTKLLAKANGVEVVENDSFLQKLGQVVGIGDTSNDLPTDIAGLTATFRPGKKWMANLLERTGEGTSYGAVEGLDMYIETAADIIHHTQDIQKLRTLETAIRQKYSAEGIKERIQEMENDDTMNADERQEKLQQLKEEAPTHLGGLVQEIRTYTDILAGKKSPLDRGVEKAVGRVAYKLVTKMEGRIAANMVAINPGSWLTNFIPLTQGSGELRKASMLRAAKDFFKATARDDGFANKSSFLTNRKGSERLTKRNIDKASEILTKPMYWIDMTTSNILMRARTMDNMEKRGMKEADAISEADNWTARVMADRSKGALPTAFGSKNPLIKLATMFQVEVNNQVSYFFKDVPRAQRENGAWTMTKVLMQAMIGAFLYNELYESIVGRRPALDPIGMVKETIADATREGAKPSKVIGGASKRVMEQVPFVGGLLGGGRLPISAALPDLEELAKVGDDISGKKKAEILAKELGKPVTYLGLPFGGGQVKKFAESTDTLLRGGSFVHNNEGEKELQFPVDTNAENITKGLLFGKYSMPSGGDYADKGFSPYSAKETKAFDILRDGGRKPTAATDVIDQLKAIKGEGKNELKRDLLLNLDGVKPSDKTLLDDLMIDEIKKKKDYSSLEAFNLSGFTDKQKERYTQAQESMGMDTEEFTKYREAIGGIEGDKDSNGKTIKGSTKKKKIDALIKLGMTVDKAEQFYELMK